MRAGLATVGAAVRAALYPARCSGCGLRGTLLCTGCFGEVCWLADPICPTCGGVGIHDTPRGLCSGATGPLSEILAAASFEGPVRQAIHALKFRRSRAHAPLLADLVARAQALNLGGIDVLVPVPLAPGRRRERGFNQSSLIARGVADRLGIPVADGLLVRTRETPSQVGRGAADRRANVRDAFACSDPSVVAGRHIAIVDDVTTTGATLRACAEPLVAAGVLSVTGLAVAKEL